MVRALSRSPGGDQNLWQTPALSARSAWRWSLARTRPGPGSGWPAGSGGRFARAPSRLVRGQPRRPAWALARAAFCWSRALLHPRWASTTTRSCPAFTKSPRSTLMARMYPDTLEKIGGLGGQAVMSPVYRSLTSRSRCSGQGATPHHPPPAGPGRWPGPAARERRILDDISSAGLERVPRGRVRRKVTVKEVEPRASQGDRAGCS